MRSASRPAAWPPGDVLRLHHPQDLIDAVPYLLGFHPQDSVVLVAVGDADGPGGLSRVGMVARVDRAAVGQEAVLDRAVTALHRSGVGRAVAVVFLPDGPLDAAGADIAALRLACGRGGLHLDDVLLVTARRWRSALCVDGRCCPSDGFARPAGPSATAVAATVAGLVALPDRGTLDEVLEAAPLAERDALLPRLTDALHEAALRRGAQGQTTWQRSQVRALFAASRRLGVLADAEVCRFAVALDDVAVRDACWLGEDRNRLSGEALWRELARRLPGTWSAAPLFLFGWGRWRAGNGTLAVMAAERALSADPDYSAAQLLLAAVQHGLDPFRTPRLRRSA